VVCNVEFLSVRMGITVMMNRKRAVGIHRRDEMCKQYLQNLLFCIFHADVTYKKVAALGFNSQQYCHKLQQPSVTILSVEQYSKTYAALSFGFSIVNGKIYKMLMSVYC
jgi:hypothetical protein